MKKARNIKLRDTVPLRLSLFNALSVEEMVSSGLPWSKANYDGIDNFLFSQSDDPFMKANFLLCIQYSSYPTV
jgi:hypothetical protein